MGGALGAPSALRSECEEEVAIMMHGAPHDRPGLSTSLQYFIATPAPVRAANYNLILPSVCH